MIVRGGYAIGDVTIKVMLDERDHRGVGQACGYPT